MSHYVHHVPGRLRVRSKALRCDSTKVRALAQELRELSGVYEVGHNNCNGSLTITYDPASDAGDWLFETLRKSGCVSFSARAGTRGAVGSAEGVPMLFGRAVIAAVAQQTVVRSFTSLAMVLR